MPHYEGLAAKIGQLLVVPLTHVMAAHGCAHDDTPSAPHLAPERVRLRPQLPRSLQTASGGIGAGEVCACPRDDSCPMCMKILYKSHRICCSIQ